MPKPGRTSRNLEIPMGLELRPAPSRKNHHPSLEPLRLPPALPAGSMAAAMAAHLEAAQPLSGAEALQILRSAFPDTPLGIRAAAVAALMRR